MDAVKSIFQSKTFWLNVVTAVATYFGQLPVTPFTMYAILAANVVMRLFTKGPVFVLKNAASDTEPPSSVA